MKSLFRYWGWYVVGWWAWLCRKEVDTKDENQLWEQHDKSCMMYNDAPYVTGNAHARDTNFEWQHRVGIRPFFRVRLHHKYHDPNKHLQDPRLWCTSLHTEYSNILNAKAAGLSQYGRMLDAACWMVDQPHKNWCHKGHSHDGMC